MMKRMLTAVCAVLLWETTTFGQSASDKVAAPPALAEMPVSAAACLGDEGPCNCRGGRFWASGEYLFAWVQGYRLPPLATTSPAGTAQGSAGVLGLPTTGTLFGGSMVTNDLRSGFRLDTGY